MVAMLNFKNVSKFYNSEIKALEEVSFDIDDGEFLFLVGPTGAGKSTLIRLLIRMETPSEGDIIFNDINIPQLTDSMIPVYRQQIGVVFQDFKLLENKTVKENIQFALEITDKTDNEISETTNYLLNTVKLENRSKLFPSQLSGGEKQRAGIARALANDPSLLIADEPTGNLDPDTASEIIEILQDINKWGTTILIATHDKETVDKLQKRVIRLQDGLLISDCKGSYDSPKSTKKKLLNKKKKKTVKIRKEKAETKKSKSKTRTKSKPETKIESLDINTLEINKKIIKKLKKNNISTIQDILDMSEDELNQLRGINKKDAESILEGLATLYKKQ